MTVDDPAFRAAITDVETVGGMTQVKRSSPSPARGADLQRPPHGTRRTRASHHRLEAGNEARQAREAAIIAADARHPGIAIEESAGLSTDKALDEEIKGGLGKAGLISIPLTIIVLMLVLGSLVAALIPLLVALTSIFATMGLLAISSQLSPPTRTSWRSSS